MIMMKMINIEKLEVVMIVKKMKMMNKIMKKAKKKVLNRCRK